MGSWLALRAGLGAAPVALWTAGCPASMANEFLIDGSASHERADGAGGSDKLLKNKGAVDARAAPPSK
jgi:hypothetical protein